MPWSNNSGGPWGGGDGGQGGGRGPWGGGGGGNRPPDIDDILRQGREKLRVIVGGGGGRGQGPQLPKLGPKGYAAMGVAVVALWAFASLYTVKPEEQAVELMFGEYIATRNPGLQFAPFPIVTYEKRAVTRENTVDIGYDSAVRGRGRDADSGLMLTGDENIVDIDFQVVWNINNLADHLFNLVGPTETIRAVSESAMREVIGRSNLSPILNRDRALISQQVQALIQQTMDSYEAGVNILRVNFDRADPPPEVIDAFRDVQAAAQDRNTQESQAEAYANRALAEARGQAAQILQEAEAYRAQTVNEAAGEAARFKAIYVEYQAAPEVTRKRLYLETIERVMMGINKVVIDETAGGASGVVPYLPLNELSRAAGDATATTRSTR
jgi:membrane protease subunit HflK